MTQQILNSQIEHRFELHDVCLCFQLLSQAAHLGNDMAYPTHTILCDCQVQKMYVGNYQEIRHFVKTHRASPNDARCKSVMQSACPTEIQSTTN
ncbi:MAG: hypothetical protein N4J56_007401 [Chroococcidiopsis sp. SAG 2025]|uniref:hypothetical protein n=1 Tax=Chroococcidiopsis sp. SAG 2025 TaxID=171389 RepID=UPI002937385D|nr:hypothetical protein [Chroococcidiopsis sp. SAG 2025]MDV2997696.1 hypothetical protein [Chroococcidiopsis sp. SAG 2025]